jgi:DNA polymerase III epsilon subunit-like protein
MKWLKLEEGVHYSHLVDLAEWFKAYNSRYGNMRYINKKSNVKSDSKPIFSYFSLAHEAMVLLGIDLNAQKGHLATQDAQASMQLYLKYKVNFFFL